MENSSNKSRFMCFDKYWKTLSCTGTPLLLKRFWSWMKYFCNNLSKEYFLRLRFHHHNLVNLPFEEKAALVPTFEWQLVPLTPEEVERAAMLQRRSIFMANLRDGSLDGQSIRAAATSANIFTNWDILFTPLFACSFLWINIWSEQFSSS